jgi:hypothetical protein
MRRTGIKFEGSTLQKVMGFFDTQTQRARSLDEAIRNNLAEAKGLEGASKDSRSREFIELAWEKPSLSTIGGAIATPVVEGLAFVAADVLRRKHIFDAKVAAAVKAFVGDRYEDPP